MFYLFKIPASGSLYFRGYSPWKIRFVTNPKISYLGIFTVIFFNEVSKSEIFKLLSWHGEVYVEKFLDYESLYFMIYFLWKLGVFTSYFRCF
jgi:hypothetical protein